MHARKGQLHPFEKSRQLQRRLYLTAKRSWDRRFHARIDRLVRPDILWRAWREVHVLPSTRTRTVGSLASRQMKVVGKPYEGEPHVRFDVAGGGDQDDLLIVSGASP